MNCLAVCFEARHDRQVSETLDLINSNLRSLIIALRKAQTDVSTVSPWSEHKQLYIYVSYIGFPYFTAKIQLF